MSNFNSTTTSKKNKKLWADAQHLNGTTNASKRKRHACKNDWTVKKSSSTNFLWLKIKPLNHSPKLTLKPQKPKNHHLTILIKKNILRGCNLLKSEAISNGKFKIKWNFRTIEKKSLSKVI